MIMPQSTLESLLFFLVLSLVASYLVKIKYGTNLKVQKCQFGTYKILAVILINNYKCRKCPKKKITIKHHQKKLNPQLHSLQ